MAIWNVTAQPRANVDMVLVAQNDDAPEDRNINLWKSVIKQAIFDVTKEIDMDAYNLGIAISKRPEQSIMPEKCSRALYMMLNRESAMYWLFKHDSDDVRSLEWICDHIGSHIDYERKKAREEIERAENDTMRKKYHKPKGTRRVFHVVAGNAILGAAL